MWLQSRAAVGPETNDQVESCGRTYLDESLVPEYFRRLRERPHDPAPALNLRRRLGYATPAFHALPEDEQVRCTAEFHRASLRKQDWIYFLDDKKVIAALNEVGSYTVMLAEDY